MVGELICFLAAACDGAVGVACIDPQMGGNGQDDFVPLPSGVHSKVNVISHLPIICGSSFHPVASTIAYTRPSY